MNTPAELVGLNPVAVVKMEKIKSQVEAKTYEISCQILRALSDDEKPRIEVSHDIEDSDSPADAFLCLKHSSKPFLSILVASDGEITIIDSSKPTIRAKFFETERYQQAITAIIEAIKTPTNVE